MKASRLTKWTRRIEMLEDRWVPAPLQFFYVPMPEQQALTALEAIGAGGQGNSITTFINITASETGTILHYDHWEDGYEPMLANPTQSTTQVWGDNNPANGIPPGFATDFITAGRVIQLRNDIPANPRDPNNIFFDGGDYIGASGVSVVSHGQFPVTTGSLLTTVVEVRDTRYFDTAFTAPVGTNTANAGQMFEFTAFFVMAALDNTTVQIDRDDNGVFDQTFVINAGDSVVSSSNVLQGGRVVSDKPVEVNLLTGDVGSNYGSRSYTLYSDSQLTNDYFTPVGLAGAGDPVRLYVHNPNAAAITVNFETQTTSGSFAVAAGTTQFFDVPNFLPNVSGTRLFSASNFAALGAYDQQDTAHDWGFSMQPVNSLTQIALVALGVGNSSNPPSLNPNTSPIWVTPIAATRVYADWDGNPATGALMDPLGGFYDQHFDLGKLQSQRVYDTTDSDNSGMRLYTVSGVAISTAWGEDPTAPLASPGFDAGSSVLAIPVPDFVKFAEFAPGGDTNGDGLFNSGDVIRYGLRIINNGTLDINNAQILDTLPAEVTYSLNSTFLDTGGGPVAIPDNGVTPFPLDETGYVLGSLASQASALFTFDVTINDPLPPNTTQISNYALLTFDIFRIPATNTMNLRSAIGDFVWDDQNLNGIQDVGEPGVGGVTVNLLDATNAVIATTTTAGNGYYQFGNLLAGTYSVEFIAPPGFVLGQQDQGGDDNLDSDANPFTGQTVQFTLGDGGSEQSIDCALESLFPPSTLSGFTWVETDNNGAFDLGELPLDGVMFTLSGFDFLGNPVNSVAFSDVNGFYTFNVSLPSDINGYTITQTQPLGYLDGIITPGSQGGIAGNNDINTIFIAPGTTGIDNNFAELPPASVSGFIYIDDNNNGLFEFGESPSGGIDVQLTGFDDLGNFIVLNTVTLPDGSYLFDQLRPGTYDITETGQPFGTLDGLSTPGAGYGGFGVPNQITGLTVNAGGSGFDYNIADILPAALGGFIYIDNNNNGLFEFGENGSAGIDVQLTGFDDQGNFVNTIIFTQPDGSYLFDNLRPGDYTITEIGQPAGTFDGLSTPGVGFGGAGVTNNISNIAVTAGGFGFNYNIADLPPSTLAGVVFFDLNDDGVQDPGELGIDGVTIDLVGQDINGNFVFQTTTTLPDGSYSFTGLLAGDYTIFETQPALYADGLETPGNFGGSSFNNDSIDFTLPLDSNATGYTFAEIGKSISGTVYLDRNRDGVLDPAEPGIGGITVTLLDSMNNVVAVTTTLPDGSYAFDDQLLQDYTVVSQLAAGHLATSPLSLPVTLTSAGVTGVNFGQTLATISGFVYRDFNLDGFRQLVAGETGIAGVTLTLTGTDVNNNPVNLITVTAADGSFSFFDLLEGNYTITETQPPLPPAPGGLYDGFNQFGSSGGVVGPQGSNTISSISLAAGFDGTDYLFGEIPPADPFGFVFIDANNNGIREPGEPGIGGVAVTISGTAFFGTPLARPLVPSDLPGNSLTIFTSASGRYDFTPMPPGLYSISEQQPGGFNDGLEENADTAGPNTVIVGNDVFSNIELSPNPVRGPFNFGELAPASLSGSVFIDVNGNGVRDGSDIGIGGVTVRLTGTSINNQPVNRVFVTGTGGTYSFTGLLPGTYSLTETQPAGFGDGADYIGTQGGVAGNDVFSAIPVGANTVGRNNNFTELVPAQFYGKERLLASTQPLGAVVNGLNIAGLPTTPSFANSVAATGFGAVTPPRYVAIGAGASGGPHVRVFDFGTGVERFNFFAYDAAFTGGVRVATGDVTGDGTDDIVTVPGPGMGALVRIFDGVTGGLFNQFFAFDPSFGGGAYVTVGDVDNNGTAEIIVGAGEGGGPHMRILNSGGGVVAERYVYVASFLGGVRVSSGDLNGDGNADVIVAAGPGGGPHVRAYSGSSGTLLHDFYAYDASFRGGVYLASGDINGDGRSDIVTGAGAGGGPHVRAFNGVNLGVLAGFFAYGANYIGGVTVGAQDTNGDGRADIICAPATNSPSFLRIVDTGSNSDLDAFLGYDASFRGGVFVG